MEGGRAPGKPGEIEGGGEGGGGNRRADKGEIVHLSGTIIENLQFQSPPPPSPLAPQVYVLHFIVFSSWARQNHLALITTCICVRVLTSHMKIQ